MSRIKTDIELEKNSTSKIDTLKKPVDGFIEFLGEYSIIGMAIGIIIGATTKDTVDALVTGIITPMIQLLLPNTKLQNLEITIGHATFQFGLFLEALLEMFIIMALVYFFIGVLLKRKDVISKKSSASKKKK
jgi:large conductance mechanosensitive channel